VVILPGDPLITIRLITLNASVNHLGRMVEILILEYPGDSFLVLPIIEILQLKNAVQTCLGTKKKINAFSLKQINFRKIPSVI
jgi:hypothetical protein